MELASYIDASTGYLRKGVDYEEFYNVYTSALDYLKHLYKHYKILRNQQIGRAHV